MARPKRRRRWAALAVVVLAAAAVGVAGGPTAAQADPLLTCPDTPVIHQICSVVTAAPNLAADGAEAVVGGVFDQATRWVVSGATSVVGHIGEAIDKGTRPDAEAEWFQPNYRLMVAVGVAFLAPLLLLAAVWSLLRHDVAGLVRTVVVKLPVAAMGMVAATWLVNLLVAITDNLSAFVGSSIGGSGERFGSGVAHLMEAGLVTGNGGLAGFLAFLVALFIALFALALWIELVVRQAAVVAATLFLPLGFAGLVWESTAHWLRKLAEGLLAFILAKFVITAVVAVGASAMAAGGDQPSALILGAGVLAVAVFAPYVLLSVIPLGSLAVVEGLSRRPLRAGTSTMSALYWGQALLGGRTGGESIAAAPPGGAGGGGAPPSAGVPPAAGFAGGAGGAAAAGAGAATLPIAAAGVAASTASGVARTAAAGAPSPPSGAPGGPGAGDGG